MRSHTLFTSAALMASAASAFPHNHASFSHPHGVSKRADPSGQTVVYWGQNGGGTIENNDLSTYCTSASGIDVIVLAFLYEFGNGQEIPVGTIGQSCYISTSGQGQDCDNVASSIPICQAAGIKVIISLGGASGSYSLTSQAEAETIGQYLWESYGNSGNTTVQRPFGNAFVNGFDFDIEVDSSGNQYYQYMISTLRSNFASDPSNTYYITGAPQCPIPEPNMGGIITSSAFDYLWVQWYNNNDYAPDPCSLGFNGGAPFNYEAWESYIAGTPSANAKIFIGAPASPLAANGSPSGEVYYITPDQLATLVGQTEGNSSFGGVMMWSAGFSDSNVNNGCTYAQESHEILLTGSPCVGSGSSSSTTTALSSTQTTATSTTISTTTSTTTSAATSTATGVVQQWGQCGGEGYTGPTQCASPYSCVSTSVWWAQCE